MSHPTPGVFPDRRFPVPFDSSSLSLLPPTPQPDPTIANVLRLAQTKVTPYGAWTRGAFARDKYGREVSERDQRAVKWCMIGAVRAVLADFPTIEERLVLRAIWRQIPWWGSGWSIQSWNDMHCPTQRAMLKAFDRAIAKSEKRLSLFG
jgi:hypothetical protein